MTIAVVVSGVKFWILQRGRSPNENIQNFTAGFVLNDASYAANFE